MVEAKKLGYYLSDDLYQNWLNYTRRQAKNSKGDIMFRVYRTYILALSGNATMSEMNLLRESKLKSMNNTQKWLLAASYSLAGLTNEAESLIQNTNTTTESYSKFSKSFGSALRDKAMILDALVTLKKYDLADKLVKDISSAISARDWYSTQTIGYSILAMGKYMNFLNNGSKNVKIKGQIIMPDGTKKSFDSNKSYSLKINKNFGKSLKIIISNETTVKKVYSNLSWDGVPLKSTVEDEAKNLSLNVKWYDEDGNSTDISELKQGTTFWGHFHVKNISSLKSVEEIALVQILPSGWEIENTRLLNNSLPLWTKALKLNYEEYLDIRDDRIMWFFDLYEHKPIYNELDFVVKINAVTIGEFDLPPTLVEAMYNGNYKATKKGKRVKVVKP
ncbi:MAG: hypothetical protein IMY72_14585 [Bacteroidetes bacterium]|nr:hypothetical protein [Bacteroidota bacterium]